MGSFAMKPGDVEREILAVVNHKNAWAPIDWAAIARVLEMIGLDDKPANGKRGKNK